MAVKTIDGSGDTEGTTIIPQVVPKSGITDAPAQDTPTSTAQPDSRSAPKMPRKSDTDSPRRRSQAVKDRDPSRTPLEVGTIPAGQVSDKELRQLVTGFVAGDIDGEVLRSIRGREGTELILRPGRQLQENNFQELLVELAEKQEAVRESQRFLTPRQKASEGARSDRSGKNALAVRTFKAIISGVTGKTEKIQREALQDEKALRPAVAAGLKRRFSEKEYIDFLSDARWYDVLRKEVPKAEFARIWEKNEKFPFQAARDDGAVEILSTVVPVGAVLKGTFRAVRLVGTKGGRQTLSVAVRKFIAEETGSIGPKFRPLRPNASITEDQQSKTISALIRAIDKARAEGASQTRLDRLHALLTRFQRDIPVRQGPLASRVPKTRRPTQAVKVIDRPVTPITARDAEQLLKQLEKPATQSITKPTVKTRKKPRRSKAREQQEDLSAKRLQRRTRRKRNQKRLQQQEEARARARGQEKPKTLPLGQTQSTTQIATKRETDPRQRFRQQTSTESRQAITEPDTKTEIIKPKATDLQTIRDLTDIPTREKTRPKRIPTDDDPFADDKDFSFNLKKNQFAKKVVFRLGAFFVTQDLVTGERIFVRTRPPKARKGSTPKQTFAVLELSTRRPTQRTFDQGNVRIRISGGGVRFTGI